MGTVTSIMGNSIKFAAPIEVKGQPTCDTSILRNSSEGWHTEHYLDMRTRPASSAKWDITTGGAPWGLIKGDEHKNVPFLTHGHTDYTCPIEVHQKLAT